MCNERGFLTNQRILLQREPVSNRLVVVRYNGEGTILDTWDRGTHLVSRTHNAKQPRAATVLWLLPSQKKSLGIDRIGIQLDDNSTKKYLSLTPEEAFSRFRQFSAQTAAPV